MASTWACVATVGSRESMEARDGGRNSALDRPHDCLWCCGAAQLERLLEHNRLSARGTSSVSDVKGSILSNSKLPASVQQCQQAGECKQNLQGGRMASPLQGAMRNSICHRSKRRCRRNDCKMQVNILWRNQVLTAVEADTGGNQNSRSMLSANFGGVARGSKTRSDGILRDVRRGSPRRNVDQPTSDFHGSTTFGLGRAPASHGQLLHQA